MTPRTPIHNHRNLFGPRRPAPELWPSLRRARRGAGSRPVPSARPSRPRRRHRPHRGPSAPRAAAAEAQTAPYVFAVSKVSADGTYNLGDTISLRVVFDVAVTVTGTPQLALNIGSRMRQADYVSGSGTATLVFSYEVVAGDEDTDGIGVPEEALTLNGGTISAGGTPANVTLGSASFSGLLVDGGPVAPTVTGVALTSAPGSDNTYAIGDAVAATVTFDAAVDITGSPQLELDFDGTAKAAACATGTNTTTMACSYTVVVGDVAAGGIAIAANKLTGGTIYATGSTTVNADLDNSAVAIDAGHKVDGIRPTLVTTGTDAPTTSTDGTQVILTFSEDLGFVDALGIETGGPGRYNRRASRSGPSRSRCIPPSQSQRVTQSPCDSSSTPSKTPPATATSRSPRRPP